jgi:predicted site-specific integrase-resolvase
MAREIPLSAAALRLGVDYQTVRRLVLRGLVRGGRDEHGRYFVDETDLGRYAREHQQHHQRGVAATVA